jgi:hypothetical protein
MSPTYRAPPRFGRWDPHQAMHTNLLERWERQTMTAAKARYWGSAALISLELTQPPIDQVLLRIEGQ